MIDRIQDTYEVLQQRVIRILECTKGKLKLTWLALWKSKSGYCGLFYSGALFWKEYWKIGLNSEKKCINILWFAL